ncbi:MAG TPA: mandelate racemase/muconate lactonizing enzyme family protein [Methylomirabilota bacterium]|nr:mandelate racemase/muconate lactonizing enzyme family protein [Methylomirabilota bacterium]
MRITGISGYRLDLPFRDGPYVCSGGRSALGFDTLIVAIATDAGITGWGEMAPLGAFYDPAFAAGARAAFEELAPKLLGDDPTQVNALARRMDHLLKGHPYAKAAIDMACWDILGKAAGLPLAELLGGRFGTHVDLYRSVSQDRPDKMVARAKAYVAEGYRRIQVKVGLDPDEDIERLTAVRAAVGKDIVLFADANGGWSTLQARRFLRATRDLDYAMEQPCLTYGECRALRGDCDRPLILDESIDSLAALVQAHADQVADGVTIKIARVGGVGRARLIRDVAVDLGIAVTVEDTGGAEIDTAAMLHLSLSTPEALRLHTVDFNNWVTRPNARGIPTSAGGRIGMGHGPGLGVEPLVETFGAPFFRVSV